MHGHGVHTGHLVLLLPLHPSILKPDLDLSLCQTQSMGYFNPAKRNNFQTVDPKRERERERERETLTFSAL